VCFSAGADLNDAKAWADTTLPIVARREIASTGYKLCKAWEEVPQITIAAIEGYAVGGGLALALACDWRVAAVGSFVSLPEISLGIPLTWGTIPRLTNLLGPAKAKRLTILCERFPAKEALNLGVLDYLAPKGRTLAKATEIANQVLAMLPAAVRMSKEAINAVATALALDDPSRVAGLVLIAPVLYPWSTGVAWYYSLTSMPVIGPLFAHTLALPAGTVLLGPTIAAVFAPQVAPADYAQRAAIRLVLRPKNFIANASDVAGLLEFVTVQAPRYSELKMPTTVITGDRDTIVSPRIHSRALADTVPHSKLIMLEGVGHMPHHVARDRVVEAIEDVVTQALDAQGDKVTR